MKSDKFNDIIDALEDEEDVSEDIMDSKSKNGDSKFWKKWNKTRDAQKTAEEKEEEDDDT